MLTPDHFAAPACISAARRGLPGLRPWRHSGEVCRPHVHALLCCTAAYEVGWQAYWFLPACLGCLRPCLPALHSSLPVLRLCFLALHRRLFGLHEHSVCAGAFRCCAGACPVYTRAFLFCAGAFWGCAGLGKPCVCCTDRRSGFVARAPAVAGAAPGHACPCPPRLPARASGLTSPLSVVHDFRRSDDFSRWLPLERLKPSLRIATCERSQHLPVVVRA